MVARFVEKIMNIDLQLQKLSQFIYYNPEATHFQYNQLTVQFIYKVKMSTILWLHFLKYEYLTHLFLNNDIFRIWSIGLTKGNHLKKSNLTWKTKD